MTQWELISSRYGIRMRNDYLFRVWGLHSVDSVDGWYMDAR